MKSTNKPSARKRSYAKQTPEVVTMVQEPMAHYEVAISAQDARVLGLLNMVHSANDLRYDTDIIQLIRSGITKKSLDYLIAQIGYTLSDIASLLHVSDRNIRRYTPSEKLNTEQSERLVEIAKLYARGEDVFGSIDDFNEWMEAKLLSLGNQTPKSFLDTSLGIQLIHKELIRIEHGVFA